MAAATQTKRLIIKVDAPGVKEAIDSIARSTGMMNKNVKSLSGNMSFLTNAFRSWVGFLGIREIIQMSDNMQNLTNRLVLVTGSLAGAENALAGLSEVSQRTFRSITDVGDAYTKFSNALKTTGATTDEMIAFTETLINSFRVSGASSEVTSQGILQLSQAFSKGKLDGDEFKTVMESNVFIAQALRKEYGQDLYKKAKDGQLGLLEVMKVFAREQKAINDGAKVLAPTFSDSLAKAFTRVTVLVGNLNKEFELSSKFAKVMDVAINNLVEIMTVLSGVAVYYAIISITNLTKAISLMTLASRAFAVSNPILLALTALATVGTLVYQNWEKLPGLFLKVEKSWTAMRIAGAEAEIQRKQALANSTGSKFIQAEVDKLKENLELLKQRDKSLEVFGPKSPEKGLDGYQKALESLTGKMPVAQDKAKSLKGELSELNKQYLRDRDIEKYYAALVKFDLGKVNRKFAEGSTDIFKYHEQLRDLDIQELERQFNRGNISLEEFNRGIANTRMQVLNEQLRAGKISLQEYNKELTKMSDMVRPGSAFQAGAADFVESVGTLSQGIARVTSQAFGHLADTLTEFIQTGKFQFADFTRSILNDISAMLVRAALVAPIARGIMGLGGGLSATAGAASANTAGAFANVGVAADGGISGPFSNVPLKKYASGGIARSPQLSLFGEAGPEAYVPLPDGRNIPVKMEGGSGGVTVMQTINVYSDGSASSDSKTDGKNAKALGDLVEKKTIETILKQLRPGGVLA